jgi:cytochrome c-type biogenesis protein CcmH/NrfF
MRRRRFICEDWILLRVVLSKPIITSPLVSQMNATLWHVPLYVSGLNATYGWVEQMRQGQTEKKLKEAEKVDLPKF